MKKYYVLAIMLLLVMTVTGIATANSLWDDSKSMYADKVAFEKGDILTVNITESSSANQQASTEASQNNQGNVGAGTGILDFIKSLGYNQSNSNSASGTTNRSSNLDATMTVKVIEVLDNDNLKISGTKEINVNGEKQKIKLEGMVRPEDVTPQNTVESTYLANVNIQYSGKGVVGDKQRQGILSKVFDWLF
ncbi:flagellar basal body L-ring protein FlgH [Halanaerobacter jeridensis]|uniref:Flagellar L-ring protein n=1 Tax=Halanaerobacter jeridensis TaxID=706427 RepID=A0A938XT21_9FIRM|nr:flagellar L-ring protein precursor FlgH [Halanaerobacter jeridensis]